MLWPWIKRQICQTVSSLSQQSRRDYLRALSVFHNNCACFQSKSDVNRQYARLRHLADACGHQFKGVHTANAFLLFLVAGWIIGFLSMKWVSQMHWINLYFDDVILLGLYIQGWKMTLINFCCLSLRFLEQDCFNNFVSVSFLVVHQLIWVPTLLQWLVLFWWSFSDWLFDSSSAPNYYIRHSFFA